MGNRSEPSPLQIERPAVNRYLLWVVGVGVPLLTVPAVTAHPLEPFILATTFLVLLPGAILTARRSGPGGVRLLFSGALHWRIGWSRWAFTAGAIPATALGVAVVTGTLSAPQDGWLSVLAGYLLFTFVIGALVLNLWEEAAWQGLVQRHLTGRHGIRKGAALTAVPFGLLHLPLAFVGASDASEALRAAALVLLLAPALRYVLGWLDQDTGGSLLAVGVLHASFNATGSLEVLDGGWQHIIAITLLAGALLLAGRRRAGRRHGAGRFGGEHSAEGQSAPPASLAST